MTLSTALFVTLVNGTALAQDTPLSFEAPETVALFTSAKQHKAEGSVPGNDCPGAIDAALTDARAKATKQGTGAILRVISDKKSWEAASSIVCTFKGKPENPKATKAAFWVIAVAPGSPESVYPRIPSADAVGLLRRLVVIPRHGSNPFDRLAGFEIYNEQGKPFVDQGKISPDGKLNTIQLNRNARATHAFQTKVIPWVGSWVSSYRDLSHIQGAAVNVLIKSENFVTKKEKRKETFRFAIPTDVAQKFVAGTITEAELFDGSSLYYSERPSDRPTQKIKIDTTSGAW